MTIKIEFLNNDLFQPFSGKEIAINTIDPVEYEYYYNNGYAFIFEVEETQNEIPDNDIPI